jgi:hypothetical protein
MCLDISGFGDDKFIPKYASQFVNTSTGTEYKNSDNETKIVSILTELCLSL